MPSFVNLVAVYYLFARFIILHCTIRLHVALFDRFVWHTLLLTTGTVTLIV